MEAGIHHDVEPGFEFVVAARPDVDPGWRDSLGFTREGKAEHVLERDKPVAPPRQEGADRGVGQVGELDLHRSAAGGEGSLDLLEGGGIRHAAEAEPGDLVERRALFGEARHYSGDREPEARRGRHATTRGFAGRGDELCLGPLDTPGQGDVTEQGQPAGAHCAEPSVRETRPLCARRSGASWTGTVLWTGEEYAEVGFAYTVRAGADPAPRNAAGSGRSGESVLGQRAAGQDQPVPVRIHYRDTAVIPVGIARGGLGAARTDQAADDARVDLAAEVEDHQIFVGRRGGCFTARIADELEMPRGIWPSDHQQRMPALRGGIGPEQDL
jgi:hypothetical protein